MKKVWKNSQRCQSNVVVDSVLEENLAVKKTPLKGWLRNFGIFIPNSNIFLTHFLYYDQKSSITLISSANI